MDMNMNDYILVVEDKETQKLSVVSSVDKDGKIQTVESLDSNAHQFMKFDAKSSIFSNFMNNFLKQFKDPSHTGLYQLASDKVEASVQALKEMLQSPQKNADTLKLMSVNWEEYAPKEQIGLIYENCINWKELEAIGVTRESLKESGELDKMLNWGKSNLVSIAIPVGDKSIHTEARLAFRENQDGELSLAIHSLRKEPRLDFPFMGVRFNDEDKQQLQERGNLGRLVELKPKNGEPFLGFVSIDPQTNELIALKSDRVRIPLEIKGVQLTEEQRNDLSQGKAVFVSGMQSKTGNTFDATLQVNADKKGLEFTFDNSPKFSERQTVKQEQGAKNSIAKKIFGVELSEKQQQALQDGRTLYIRNMTDKAGEPFNAYIKVDPAENRLRFYKWNPDKKEAQGEEKVVAVAEEHKTQVAVNNKGKTNDASKHIKEPLKQGQTEPIPSQKREQKQEQQKKRGRKM